jgi:hypothetical protein
VGVRHTVLAAPSLVQQPYVMPQFTQQVTVDFLSGPDCLACRVFALFRASSICG